MRLDKIQLYFCVGPNGKVIRTSTHFQMVKIFFTPTVTKPPWQSCKVQIYHNFQVLRAEARVRSTHIWERMAASVQVFRDTLGFQGDVRVGGRQPKKPRGN